jgi:hypothetical protein
MNSCKNLDECIRLERICPKSDRKSRLLFWAQNKIYTIFLIYMLTSCTIERLKYACHLNNHVFIHYSNIVCVLTMYKSGIYLIIEMIDIMTY